MVIEIRLNGVWHPDSIRNRILFCKILGSSQPFFFDID